MNLNQQDEEEASSSLLLSSFKKKGGNNDIQQKKPPSWGLDRIDQSHLPLNSMYSYENSAGKGIDVYVIDTGIEVDHTQFEGRASWGASFSTDGENDGNGHGTHVAGKCINFTFFFVLFLFYFCLN